MSYTTSSPDRSEKRLHIVFLHLDLGIGGAEQLIVNLALASLPPTDLSNDEGVSTSISTEGNNKETHLNAHVSILTTHCNQDHCFDAVNQTLDPPGILSSSVHVLGESLPVTIFGKGTAFCSTLRMMYLSYKARKMYPNADVFVLDVLPTSIPYLVQKSKCVIFYCHFPDKLLTRDTVNGERESESKSNDDRDGTNLGSESGSGGSIKAIMRNQYRNLLDYMEESAMSYADLICVNSKFTKQEVMRAFPSIGGGGTREQPSTCMQVLYPAIDLNKFIPPDFIRKEQLMDASASSSSSSSNRSQTPIVSLNRFERKKNIQVLLHAYASIRDVFKKEGKLSALPPLVISGGYDPRNPENVEYLTELKSLAQTLDIETLTQFRPSVSDEERAKLLQSALFVVYTPYREHFGIVPLEAMYAGSAVIAINSGGPKETVLDGISGILVEMEPELIENLAKAMRQLLNDPAKAIEMGKRGHEHVKKNFGLKPFRREWQRLVLDTGIPTGRQRQVHPGKDQRLQLFLTYFVILVAWYAAKYFIFGTTG